MQQRDLFGPRDTAAGRRLDVRGTPVRLLHWLPVLCALGLFAQISLGGLRPALEERARLERLEGALERRHAQLVQETHRLEVLRAAQRDPVYLERERRHRLDPAHSEGYASGLPSERPAGR